MIGRDLPLEELIGLDRLLDDAFAPGRRRHAPIAAARVRARVAWDRPREVGPAARGIALLGRMGQAPAALALIVALGVGSSSAVERSVVDDAGTVISTSRTGGGDIDEFRLRRLRVAASPPSNDMLDPSALPREANAPSADPENSADFIRRGMAR